MFQPAGGFAPEFFDGDFIQGPHHPRSRRVFDTDFISFIIRLHWLSDPAQSFLHRLYFAFSEFYYGTSYCNSL